MQRILYTERFDLAIRAVLENHWLIAYELIVPTEASLRMVAPGAEFCGGILHRPKYR